ncbi:MAG: hypothetical protein KDC26_00200 [Armatimonadetes bacterium]|nr:hypothetical protein [Armatimonadota bacterium]
MELLITGFTAFGPHEKNPTEWLAEESECSYQILPVDYRGVDEWLEERIPEQYGAWLMMGVHGSAEKFHLEAVGRNVIGVHPDNSGFVAGPGPIDAAGPHQLSSSLWVGHGLVIETEARHLTTDAGSYLCDFLLYRGLQLFPNLPLGFLHVPTFDVMPAELQLAELKSLIEELKSAHSLI